MHNFYADVILRQIFMNLPDGVVFKMEGQNKPFTIGVSSRLWRCSRLRRSLPLCRYLWHQLKPSSFIFHLPQIFLLQPSKSGVHWKKLPSHCRNEDKSHKKRMVVDHSQTRDRFRLLFGGHPLPRIDESILFPSLRYLVGMGRYEPKPE